MAEQRADPTEARARGVRQESVSENCRCNRARMCSGAASPETLQRYFSPLYPVHGAMQRSAAETDLEIFLSVSVKSSMVTGICSSSLDRARISSGLRPWIRRRIAIMAASLM
ncbi:hypothetical protein EYF80_047954 [Liparis tanakae]|uniref:Uncharacterized protein n=1 Tax=Liparis tanakae TaxID=230148 RepID=A0A4Z2FKW8_9TELE|nr:hypothetical protein EYF80_047954 [Liparis tanakae]